MYSKILTSQLLWASGFLASAAVSAFTVGEFVDFIALAVASGLMLGLSIIFLVFQTGLKN